MRVNLDDALEIASDSRDREIMAIDDALNELAEIDLGRPESLSFDSSEGLSVEETAEVLKTSPQKVMRDWKMATAWLLAELAR